MKRRIVLLFTILLFCIFSGIIAYAEIIPSNIPIATPLNATKEKDEKISNSDYEYELVGDRAILTQYISKSGNTNIIVPETIDGYQVDRLEGTFQNNKNIESVIIPEGVKYLGENTFLNCKNLKNVELPNSLFSIDRGCFVDCDSLEELVIPSKVDIDSGGWVVIRGNSLYKIINLSKFDLYPFGDIPEDGYAWYLSEDGGEPIDYIPANATVYRLKNENKAKTETEKFLEEYKRKIYSNPIYAGEVNSKEQVLEFLNNIKPKNQNIKCEFEITFFLPSEYKVRPTGQDGRSVVKIKAYDITNPDDILETTVYIDMKYKPDELEEKYKNIYVEMLDKLEKTGVSMSIANTRNDMKKYIEYLISQNSDSKLIVSVDIRPNDEYNYFRSAKAGTIKNPNGVNGSCYVKIDIKNKSPLLNDLGGISTGGVWGDYHVIPIKAIKYSSGSSNSSSSSGSSDSDNSENEYYGKNYFHTTGGNLMSGTWVRQGGKWKLRTESGSYARSQWANLDNKWYLLGPDSYMRTGWQMVNNQWYLLGLDGVMLTGWYTDNGKIYWLEPSGEMATGWKWIEDKWYYMDSTGAMMRNTITPDGYRVNSNGEWVDME